MSDTQPDEVKRVLGTGAAGDIDQPSLVSPELDRELHQTPELEQGIQSDVVDEPTGSPTIAAPPAQKPAPPVPAPVQPVKSEESNA